MKLLSFIALFIILFAGCKKSDDSQPSARSLLMNRKWYYHSFREDGLVIRFDYCDVNNYLLFSDGGKGGIGNDEAGCRSQQGIYSTFSYSFSADSNLIHIKDTGGSYTWIIKQLNKDSLEVLFTVPTPPPAYAPNYDYIYSTR